MAAETKEFPECHVAMGRDDERHDHMYWKSLVMDEETGRYKECAHQFCWLCLGAYKSSNKGMLLSNHVLGCHGLLWKEGEGETLGGTFQH